MDENVKPRAIDIAKLARDIAMDILGTEKVLEIHQISPEDWELIKSSRAFQTQLADMAQAWNDASNTKARVRVAAATAVESLIEPMVACVLDETIPYAQRVEGWKVLIKLGGMGDEERMAQGGERFSIQIIMGAQAPTTTIEGVVAEPVLELTTTRP
jgi:hypothetical protein